jgi:pimeloyl-ACP methyl ester carboxylesterase
MPTITTGDIDTYYEVAGSGPPLVLVCGISAELQVWRNQVDELSKHFSVIRYDNRGAGRSSAPDSPYSIPQMADDLAALLDALQIDATHLLGWSMGGYIAQAFARRYPQRVLKLLLLSTAHEPDGYVRLAIRNWMNIRSSNMPYEQIVRFVLRWQFTPAAFDNEVFFEKAVQMMTSNPYAQKADAFLQQAEASLAYIPGDAVLPASTLVMVGADDNLLPPYLSERLAKAIPGATLRVLRGAHAGFLEFPAEYNKAILDFLHE